jgi:Ca2+-dependent lipid-binding protein
MDPFLQIMLGGSQWKTFTKEDAGTTPKFEQTFDMTLETGDEVLEIKAFDKNNTLSDDIIGMFSVPIKKFPFNGEK